MAAASFAIELPTSRQSKYYSGPGPNVHDPNYIPVLNGAHLRVDFSQPSFSALPSIPTPHTSESQTSLKRSKSASAPETVVHNHAAHPMPPRSAITSPAAPQEIGSSHQPDRLEDARFSNLSADNRISSSDTSTTGPANVLEEHIFMIPGNSAPKVEEILSSTVLPSARSSFSSSRKGNVPTSKYSKRSTSKPNIPHPAAQNAHISPSSERISPENGQQEILESTRSTPMPPSSVDLSSAIVSTSTSAPRSQVRGSTASERRARALHSHPSNVSLRSRKNSTLQETDELPLMPHTFQPGSRASSTRSRQSICNSTPPTPAPNAPLPDLPVGAKRPPTREKPLDKPLPPSCASPHCSSPGKPQNDHMEMAEFMTTQKTTVFRRFDEIHVRLLLQLQDEITSLEKALKEIEDAESHRPDQAANKANILRDLRKTLAEYDHLFANWSSMQANKATPEAKRELEKWLQSPGLGLGKVSKTAMDDLHWLQTSKDLSSVSIDPEKHSHKVKTSESFSKDSTVGGTATEGGGRGGGGGGGGFLALFGCASKRK